MNATVRILRFDPQRDEVPHWQTYRYEGTPGMTVLDVLNLLRATQDPTLSYAYNCRNGHCGLCALMVNGTAALSCHKAAAPDMELRPLEGFPVCRDLVVDREAYERRRPALRLFPERRDPAVAQPEPVDMERFSWFRTASRCIECYCCVAACPVYRRSFHQFAGPAALMLEARLYFDPRDQLDRTLVAADMGLARCVSCGRCSAVCPQDASPCEILTRMKTEIET